MEKKGNLSKKVESKIRMLYNKIIEGIDKLFLNKGINVEEIK